MQKPLARAMAFENSQTRASQARIDSKYATLIRCLTQESLGFDSGLFFPCPLKCLAHNFLERLLLMNRRKG